MRRGGRSIRSNSANRPAARSRTSLFARCSTSSCSAFRDAMRTASPVGPFTAVFTFTGCPDRVASTSASAARPSNPSAGTITASGTGARP